MNFIHLINAQNIENIKLIILCAVSEFEARRNMPTLMSIGYEEDIHFRWTFY
jgi:hypothetical protein